MRQPFDYIKLYRKETEPDPKDIPESELCIDQYDQYPATLDLEEIINIEPSVVDRKRTTTIHVKAGFSFIALVAYEKLKAIVLNSQNNADRNNLLTNKQ